MTAGENIRKIRNEKHITMKQLAEKINVSEQAIGNYERGDRRPSVEILIKISKALSVDLSKLIESEIINIVNDTEEERLEKTIKAKQEISGRDVIYFIGKISGMLQSEAYSRSDIKNVADNFFSLYKQRTSLDILKDLIISEGYNIENISNEILNEILKKVLDVLELEFYKLDK